MKSNAWGLVLAFLLLAAATAYGATTSATWSSWLQIDLQPAFGLGGFDSALTIGYTIGGWTLSSTALLDETGLWNIFFDAGGALGGFVVRSLVDFDATAPELRAWLSSVRTAIGGVRFYGLFMIDDVHGGGAIGDAWFGTGSTLGAIWEGDSLAVWAQVQFNMTDSSRYVYLYGVDWLMDHFVFEDCGYWYVPPTSSYVDVQTGGCSVFFSGLSLYVEFPICCADVLAQVSFSDSGLDHILLELLNVDLGLTWMNVEWVDLWYTLDSKSANVVFETSIADNLCFTPYIGLTGGGAFIDGIELRALLFECTWNGYTFKAGHLFDENGWEEHLNYAWRPYGWTWDGELSYLASCKVPDGYDEFFGIEVLGDACCGGEYGLSAFAWFDTGKSTGIFDWVETRVMFRTAISPNIDLRFGMSVAQSGHNWVGMGFDLTW